MGPTQIGYANCKPLLANPGNEIQYHSSHFNITFIDISINFHYLGDGQNDVLSIFAKLKSIFQDDGSGAEITEIN